MSICKLDIGFEFRYLIQLANNMPWTRSGSQPFTTRVPPNNKLSQNCTPQNRKKPRNYLFLFLVFFVNSWENVSFPQIEIYTVLWIFHSIEN